jgi:hypothetical protein
MFPNGVLSSEALLHFILSGFMKRTEVGESNSAWPILFSGNIPSRTNNVPLLAVNCRVQNSAAYEAYNLVRHEDRSMQLIQELQTICQFCP